MSPVLLSLRIMALALVGSVVFFALALWFVVAAPTGSVGTDDGGLASPPAWSIVAVLGAGVACLLLIPAVGYRARPVPPGTPPEQAAQDAVGVFRAGLMLRFVLAEVPVLVGMALAFVVEQGGYVVFLLGAVCTVLLAVRHVWTGDRQVARVQERLESAGARVPLREALRGGAPAAY